MAIELEFQILIAVADVWQVIGDPGRIDWVAGVAACDYDGKVRRFKMEGAGELAEEIIELNDATHTIVYGVIESTPPLAKHRASMALTETAQGSLLTWHRSRSGCSRAFYQTGHGGSAAKLLTVLG